MYGDKIYCLNCGNFSKDITQLESEDSRTNGNYRNQCFHCGGTNTINATAIHLEAERIRVNKDARFSSWNRYREYRMLRRKSGEKDLNSLNNKYISD